MNIFQVHDDLETVWRRFFTPVKHAEVKKRLRLLFYDTQLSEEKLRFLAKNWKFLSTRPGAVLEILTDD